LESQGSVNRVLEKLEDELQLVATENRFFKSSEEERKYFSSIQDTIQG